MAVENQSYERLIEIADQAETIQRYMSSSPTGWDGVDDLEDLINEAIPILEALAINRELDELREIVRRREVGIPISDWEWTLQVASSLRDSCEEHKLNLKILKKRSERQKAHKITEKSDPAPYGYVSKARIEALKSIKGSIFDLRKLIRLCEEVNLCHKHDCSIAVASLVRTITNHVPPIFGCKSYATYVSQCSAGRSVRSSLERLDKNLRDIADNHLHEVMRAHANLPTAMQVNFSPELDVLLGEVEVSARTRPENQ